MEEARQKIRSVLSANSDTSKGQSKKTILTVTEDDAAKILRATGIDVAGYQHAIDKSGINHSYSSHGKNREHLRGQRVLTEKDFLRIPEIITEYDSVSRPLNQKGAYAKSSSGNELILYTKRFNDGSTYYVEEVRTGKKELVIATMWVVKNGELKNSSPSFGNEKMLSKNAPFALTSETLSHHKGTNNSEASKESTEKVAPSEQTLTAAQMLEGTLPIEAPRHDFKNIDQARKWAKENIVGTYKNDSTGEDIYVSKTAIDKYLSKKAVKKSVSVDAHLSALKILPSIIETSMLREVQQDRGNNADIKEIQRFYGAISYEKSLHPVKTTVKVYPIGNSKAYSYEVMEIENPIWQREHSNESSPRSGYSENRRHFDAISIPTHNPNLPLVTETHPTAESRRLVAEKQATDISSSKGTNNSETSKESTEKVAPSEQTLTAAQMLEGTLPIEAPRHDFKNFGEARTWG